jgi:hypothetical protein
MCQSSILTNPKELALPGIWDQYLSIRENYHRLLIKFAFPTRKLRKHVVVHHENKSLQDELVDLLTLCGNDKDK